MAQIIDGKALAKSIIGEIAEKVKKIKAVKNISPKLAVILVGEDPGSQIYVRNKEKDCEAAGIISETYRLKADIEEKEILALIESLNINKNIHGILVQLPLPKKLNEEKITNKITPEKDVDGLHTINMGKLFKGEAPYFMPCTPSGCLEMLLSTGVDIKGKEAVVVGRSNIVGKPMAIMLLSKHATVTICHSRTERLGEVCRRADILVAAVGKARLIKGAWIKPGAVVIDVGMNRLETGLVGDVDFNEAKEVASYISPVPGGVGPMTRAMLVKNTFIAAERA
ncbi:MAG: bifunctional methylenetetrahydrofolate dehydrogenase/methenyltetrahydrofolate cyclohydrolase FolD [Candidatus Margulisiibacteriota bacterium]